MNCVIGTRKNIQADAQSLLLAFTDDDTKLVNDVFPRMAPDEVSMVVKTDPLIRAFGLRYLNGRFHHLELKCE